MLRIGKMNTILTPKWAFFAHDEGKTSNLVATNFIVPEEKSFDFHFFKLLRADKDMCISESVYRFFDGGTLFVGIAENFLDVDRGAFF